MIASSRNYCGRVLVLGVALGIAACTPTHTVKPLENFVKVGLEPGDTVTVVTHSGEEHEFVVKEIRGDVLFGDGVEYVLHELATIRKHAWSRPESPCGGVKPLGCSVPWFVSLTSESHAHYEDKFYDACAQHDYCYRHGAASYGLDRNACDDNFLDDMLSLCPDPATGKMGKFFEVLDGSLDSRRTCEQVADDYYEAVRRYGEERFETAGSTYCEYNGPPAAPLRAPVISPGSSTSE